MALASDGFLVSRAMHITSLRNQYFNIVQNLSVRWFSTPFCFKGLILYKILFPIFQFITTRTCFHLNKLIKNKLLLLLLVVLSRKCVLELWNSGIYDVTKGNYICTYSKLGTKYAIFLRFLFSPMINHLKLLHQSIG